MKKIVLVSILSVFFLSLSTFAGNDNSTKPEKNTSNETSDNKLVVVWTSGDKEVAMKMVFMYTFNAKKFGWWDDITLLIWGPSQKLLTEDKDLQDYLKKMKEKGIHLLACKGCADQYQISDKLTELGVKVKYTGVDITNFIKERHVITF